MAPEMLFQGCSSLFFDRIWYGFWLERFWLSKMGLSSIPSPKPSHSCADILEMMHILHANPSETSRDLQKPLRIIQIVPGVLRMTGRVETSDFGKSCFPFFFDQKKNYKGGISATSLRVHSPNLRVKMLILCPSMTFVVPSFFIPNIGHIYNPHH